MTGRGAWAAAIWLAASGAACAGTQMSYLGGYGAKAYPVVALTWFLLGVSILVCIIVGVLVLWGALARRSFSAFASFGSVPVERRGDGLSWITIGVAATFVALVVSVIWTVAVLAAVNQPKGAEPFTIEVTGHQWWWRVRYLAADPTQGFTTANEIHIPVGHPVRFLLKGGDVIHSFWVPALSGKTDTIPGQTNVTWLEADHVGMYRGQCTEYCGVQHAQMAVFVEADTPKAFEAWWRNQLKPASPPVSPDATQGQALFVTKCGACHAVRGTDAGGTVAPDLTHLMTRQTIAAGAAPNTAAGLSGWIANPQGVKPGTKMPTLYLSGPELGQISAFLETLK